MKNLRHNARRLTVAVAIAAFALTFTFPTHADDQAPSRKPPLRITAPPASLKLPAFYKKHASARGLPVLGSAKVMDAAMLEAAYLIDLMLKDRPDVRRAMIRNRTRFVVMAVGEMTTDVPEHSRLEPKSYWDRRARGLGAIPRRPVCSCGEENLLGLRGDPYHAENILIHEFAHSIHYMGLNFVDEGFDEKLRSLYNKAMTKGLWKGKYAANRMRSRLYTA